MEKSKISFNKNTIFYILDIGARGGGGEALYQLRLDLEQMGYTAYILYYRNDLSSLVLPNKFLQYFNGKPEDFICTHENIKDIENNCVIVPEAATTFLFRYKNMKKIVWWLSIKFYDGEFVDKEPKHTSIVDPLKKIYHYLEFWKIKLDRLKKYHKFRYPLNQVNLHLTGSYYAYEVLKSKYKINSELFIHSIGHDFLKLGEWTRSQDTTPREDVVLYNPAKPSKVMKKLLKRNKFKYVPICNMTPIQMIELFRRSKLYVDFGHFPGPERLPKETVYNGVTVLVGKRNASVNAYDVMIPEEYKLKINTSLKKIEAKIANMLEHYDEIYHEFDSFRQMVTNMEPIYYEQMKKIFTRGNI